MVRPIIGCSSLVQHGTPKSFYTLRDSSHLESHAHVCFHGALVDDTYDLGIHAEGYEFLVAVHVRDYIEELLRRKRNQTPLPVRTLVPLQHDAAGAPNHDDNRRVGKAGHRKETRCRDYLHSAVMRLV